MYTQYYDILGIKTESTLSEIKAAFREKAKLFHPDRNPDPEAGDKFIAINEAYTFLLRLRSGIADAPAYETPDPNEIYREWLKEERKKARKRAAERAKMRFEEYRRSPIYKTTSKLNHLMDSLIIVFACFIILAGAFGLYTQGLYVIENGEEVLNVRGIFLEFTLTVIAILFIAVALASIRRRKRINSRYN